MHQTTAFLSALKRCLKAKDLTYADLGESLGLSEASVKRMFSHESLSLQRIEKILSVLDLTFLDVARLAAPAKDAAQSQLSLEQERALASDAVLCSVFHLLLFGWSVARIIHSFEVTRLDVERNLRTLEELELLERFPHDRVRLRVQRNVSWRPQGPLREAYQDVLRQRFLDDPFETPHAMRKMATWRLSPESRAIMLRKLKHLMDEMGELSEVDTAQRADDSEIHGLYVAFRPCELDGIIGLVRRR